MSVLGIDVSSRVLDWRPLTAAGVGFIISRLGTEPGGIDAAGMPNVAGARAAGIVPGVYEFLTGPFTPAGGPRLTPADRAKRFASALGNPAGVLVALDVETPSYPDLHPVPIAADVDAWMNAWHAIHPSHPVLQYGSNRLRNSGPEHGPLWRGLWFGASLGRPLREAYAAAGGDASPVWSSPLYTWPRASFWQFTRSISGLGVVADGDAFHGSADELRALACTPVPVVVPASRFRAAFDHINIRSGPGISNALVGSIPVGAVVTARRVSGGNYAASGGIHHDWLALETVNNRPAAGRYAAGAFFRAL